METATMPASIEEAQVALTGLSELLTATEWEKAAIVAAFVEVSENQTNLSHASSSMLSPVDFAALGIAGLRSKDTVRRYVKAWENTGLDRPKPGENVALPLTSFSETAPASKKSGEFEGTDAAINANPASVARVLADTRTAAKVVGRMTPEAKQSFVASIAAEVDEDGNNIGAANVAPMISSRDDSRLGDRFKELNELDRARDREDSTDRTLDMGHSLNRAAQLIRGTVKECKGASFSEENRELLLSKTGQIESLTALLRAGVAGESGTDWDEALKQEMSR